MVHEHPQRLELPVRGEYAQVLGADRGDRYRMGVVSVGLAAMAGVEHPGTGGQLGGHVDDALTGLEQALGQRTPGAKAALHGPLPVRPLADVLPHRRVAGLVGGEPARPEKVLASINDLDGR